MNAWFADRQGARWAEQTIGNAFPATIRGSAAASREQTLRELADLERRGALTEPELERLRARRRV
jgi:hypothetical protein